MTFRQLSRLVALAALLLGGCTLLAPKADVSRRYVLDAIPASAAPASPLEPTLALGVFNPEIPTYLDHMQMTTRLENNQPALHEFERWAEPLDEGLGRVLAQDIRLISGSNHVAVLPVPHEFGQEFEVHAQIEQFDGQVSGDIILRVQWYVTGPGGRPNYYTKNSVFTRRASGADLAKGYVDALDALAGDWAREIVQSMPLVRANKLAASLGQQP